MWRAFQKQEAEKSNKHLLCLFQYSSASPLTPIPPSFSPVFVFRACIGVAHLPSLLQPFFLSRSGLVNILHVLTEVHSMGSGASGMRSMLR